MHSFSSSINVPFSNVNNLRDNDQSTPNERLYLNSLRNKQHYLVTNNSNKFLKTSPKQTSDLLSNLSISSKSTVNNNHVMSGLYHLNEDYPSASQHNGIWYPNKNLRHKKANYSSINNKMCQNNNNNNNQNSEAFDSFPSSKLSSSTRPTDPYGNLYEDNNNMTRMNGANTFHQKTFDQFNDSSFNSFNNHNENNNINANLFGDLDEIYNSNIYNYKSDKHNNVELKNEYNLAPIEMNNNDFQLDNNTSQVLSSSNLGTSDEVQKLLTGVLIEETRYHCIHELCKYSDNIINLGDRLWHTPGIMQVFLFELAKVYGYMLAPQSLKQEQYHIICSIVALMQRIVLQKSVRIAFMNGKVLFYIIPFLSVTGSTRDEEHLRVCMLSFLATIAQKFSTQDIEEYLLLDQSDIFRCTVGAVDYCTSEVGRSMALLLLSKVLQSKKILYIVSNDIKIFREVIVKLHISTMRLAKRSLLPTACLDKLKKVLLYILQCFICLCANSRLRQSLSLCLPEVLTNTNLIRQKFPDVEMKLHELWKLVDASPIVLGASSCAFE